MLDFGADPGPFNMAASCTGTPVTCSTSACPGYQLLGFMP